MRSITPSNPPILASLLLVFSLGGSSVHGQGEPPDDRLIQSDPRSILTEDVMSGKTVLISSIADLETRDVREAPAHVQVITSRQIAASGSRDLFEVLGLVPGLSFGRDRDDVIGVAIHGLWALEGKCLFMLNGTPVNENNYGSQSIGQRIPLTNVDRIEVVMGSGTIIHGDYAALAVINIITRTADGAAGTQASLRTGFTPEGLTRTQASLSGAHRLSRDHEISYLIASTRGRLSNAHGLLPDGTPISYQDSTDAVATSFQFNYRWKQLKAFMSFQEENTDVSDALHQVLFRNVLFGAEYRRTLSKSLELTAKLVHADQSPWFHLNTINTDELTTNAENQRTSASLFLSYKPTNWLNLRVGAQAYHQRTRFQVNTPEAIFSLNGTPALAMNDGAAFAEATIHGVWGNLTAGQRVEHNDLAGDFTAPRLAYTLARGRFHGKLLWSKAFRIPTVMNMNYGPADGSLIAEHVTTTEAELGTKLGSSGQLSINIYETRIEDPIVHRYDSSATGSYVNRTSSGTKGFDLRFSIDREKWTVLAGFGMQRAITDADIPEHMLPDSISSGYQGIPSARAFAVVAWDASSHFTLRTRAQWQDAMWSYQYQDTQQADLVLMEWPSELLLNAGLTIRPNGKDRLAIDLGCTNILDQERLVLSPSTNALSPLRLNGREWTLAVVFKFMQ